MRAIVPDRQGAGASPETPTGVPSKKSCACGGGCPRCTAGAQAKSHADSDERHEREADRLAQQVANAPASAAGLARVEKADGASSFMQKKLAAESTAHPGEAAARQAIGGGQPLPRSTRAFMEPRLSADFGRVRVHTGDDAAQMNRELRSRAFTFGSDIWLGANENVHDKKLMAHELTHVIQQQGRDRMSAGGGASSAAWIQRSPAARGPTFEDCPGGWQDMIREAVRQGETWVDHVISGLETVLRDPATPLPALHEALVRHFRMDEVPERDRWSRTIRLLRDFREIRVGFEDPPFECESSCNRGVRGYVYTGLFGLIRTLSDVHLCPDWFSLPDALRRTVDVIHEIAHKYADKDDLAYEFKPSAYDALTAGEALENADSFGAFARDVR